MLPPDLRRQALNVRTSFYNQPFPRTPGKARWWVCTNTDCEKFDGDLISSQFDYKRCSSCGEELTYVADIGEWDDLTPGS